MMVSPRYLRLVPLLALLAALAGCGNESATIRYRATATMVIDGEVHEGSAVHRVKFTDTPHSLTGFGMAVDDDGEGIVVETGLEDHAVYVLLHQRSGSKVMHFAMMQCFGIDSGLPDYDWIGALRDIPTGKTCNIGAESIHKLARPLVVAFRRESVPASIFEVTPKSLKSAFNVDGYFRDMTFERVPDNTPLTKAIDQRLPWLNDIPFEGSDMRVLAPFDATKLLAKDATLPQQVTDYYFRD
jgi:hypothetical protein